MLKKTFFSAFLGIIILSSFDKPVYGAGDECKRLGQPCKCSDGSQTNCVPAPASDTSFCDFKCPCK